jgi:hypothetical protein
MAEVAVFAEDAMVGCLPGICVRDGIPTDDRLPVRATPDVGSGGLGLAWLLILLGPIGWAALVVVALARRPRGGIVVHVPYSPAATRRLLRTRRIERGAVVTVVGLMVVEIAVLLADPPWTEVATTLLVVVIALAAATTVVSALQLVPLEVRARLDASRRWVTLTNVGPSFAFAAWEQSRSHTDLPTGVRPPTTGDAEVSAAS